jgi:hypothetical protein
MNRTSAESAMLAKRRGLWRDANPVIGQAVVGGAKTRRSR